MPERRATSLTMDHPTPPDSWAALEAAFAEAHALDGAARARWLEACAARDPALAAEVRALLAADEGVGAMDALAPRFTPVRTMLAGTEPAPVPPQVGPYEVTGEIGRGASGLVYRAHDPRLGRDTALKIFAHVDGAADPEERMLVEARAASALDHPHICTIYDVCTLDDGRPYIAMAYYPGGTLADRIAAGPLAIRDAARIALQLAEALACAHAAGIVHRDVKPRNVAFAEGDVAKLLDFGVAVLRDRSQGRGSAGTLAYMAPEQVRGEPVDARADLWALGVVLFEMLAGRRPFVDDDRLLLRHAILEAEIPDVRTLRRDVPAPLAELVAAMLRRAPAERPAGAGEVALALRATLGIPRPSRVMVAPPRRRRWPLAVGAALAVAAAALAWAARDDGEAAATAAAPDLVARARTRYHEHSPESVEEAISLLHSALAREPRRADAHALLALAFARATGPSGAREGEARWLDSAVVHAREAIRLAPRAPDGHLALGAALAAQRREEDALAAYRAALALEPRHAATMLQASQAALRVERYEESFALLERALLVDPSLPEARAAAVSRYRTFDLPDEARRHLDAGLALDPVNGELQWNGVLLELWVGDTAAARALLERTLALRSAPEQARLRAWFAMLRGDQRAARPWVERVVATGTASYDRYLYGTVFRLTGDTVRGDSLLALELERYHAEERRLGAPTRGGLLNQAHIHATLGHRDTAMRLLAGYDSLGGLGTWRDVDWSSGFGLGWRPLRDDPRFTAIVRRSQARAAEARRRIIATLAAMRGAGELR